MTRLEAIRQRLAAATPGPWTPCTWDPMDAPHVHVNVDEQSQRCTRRNSFTVLSKADAETIAHAPDDLRALLEGIDVMGRWIADPTRMSNYRTNAEAYVKSRNVDGLYYIIREMLDDCQRVNNIFARLDAEES